MSFESWTHGSHPRCLMNCCLLTGSLPLAILFCLEKINACGLLRSVNSRDGLERFQVNDLDRARLCANPFDRNERVTIVGRYDCSVDDLSFRWYSRKLAPRFQINDRNGLIALVGSDQPPVLSRGQIVNAPVAQECVAALSTMPRPLQLSRPIYCTRHRPSSRRQKAAPRSESRKCLRPLAAQARDRQRRAMRAGSSDETRASRSCPSLCFS